MTRQEVMAPAIDLAEDGFILNEDLANQFQQNLRQMQDFV